MLSTYKKNLRKSLNKWINWKLNKMKSIWIMKSISSPTKQRNFVGIRVKDTRRRLWYLPMAKEICWIQAWVRGVPEWMPREVIVWICEDKAWIVLESWRALTSDIEMQSLEFTPLLFGCFGPGFPLCCLSFILQWPQIFCATVCWKYAICFFFIVQRVIVKGLSWDSEETELRFRGYYRLWRLLKLDWMHFT